MDGGGQLMQLALTKSNISCTGTQKADQLYHLDMPNTSMWEYAFLAVHYVETQAATLSTWTS